jgi:hypothetical protein
LEDGGRIIEYIIPPDPRIGEKPVVRFNDPARLPMSERVARVRVEEALRRQGGSGQAQYAGQGGRAASVHAKNNNGLSDRR